MNINEKLKLLRCTKGLTQKQLSGLLEVSVMTYQRYEYHASIPEGRVMQKLCQQFPEYALWLMSDDIDVGTVENKTLKNNQYLTDELSSDVFMRLAKKLKRLRCTKGLTQKTISALLEVNVITYQMYEYQTYLPGGRVVQKLCNQFPQYTLWLMTDGKDVENIKNQVLKQS